MKISLPLYGLAVLSIASSRQAVAQSTSSDTTLLAAAKSQVAQHYTAHIQDQSQLYNGPEYFNYTRYYQEVQGNQFFGTATAQPGSVYYAGHYYSNVPLLYDTRLDQVVVQQPTNLFTLRLVSEKVSRFTLQGHTFIRLTKDTAANQDITPGFYDLLVDKGVTLLARRVKKIQVQPSQNITKASFSATNQYFIKRDRVYYPVKGRGSFISLFPDRRRELQQYAREKKLRFRKKGLEDDLIALVNYYASLPQ
ncbi:hypothetical protein [Hymenobacter mucosus]|uniref:Uncharacterized protein n=1 Tax=Hymenobacter mucosus TaxID=1411120 RepID=A0A238YXP4_9BACT|nr:hypothetical protein [Hymenobacter mucosus]SNR75867.1 hypothetical protein SAMN06269173_106175 [Hymenobacter mucosus]